MRLQWWREEPQRLAAGTATHPWLRAAPGLPELSTLIEAAAIDLASGHLGAGSERRLDAELFILAARVLQVQALTAPQRRELEELGRWVRSLEASGASAAPARADRAPREQSGLPDRHGERAPVLAPALQRPLAPLLVWAALAAHHARRRHRRQHAAAGSATISASRLDGFADNILAWRVARRAARGLAGTFIHERYVAEQSQG